ncbi:class I SAM-dependent methyltransferase [Caldibacillus debilis]|uniref:class I SAM-dependent methyltransferase n=1 Tax=Caldibacillus debilis TaxID=301148 RepID=UPI000B575D4F|nr:class I SAM-dependent methyltransferase [Caldibacillus debilis]MBY6271142.1 SAM-dependent methyltransferase [Bacillaceae bacterium]OUM91063.1 MAG: hypothetical protein BAA03_07415 [Caldibacillus debilis]
MQLTAVEKLFHILDQSALILENELNCTYLEALVETGENLFQNRVLQQGIDEFTAKKLEKFYSDADLSAMEKEDIRKAFQLACLKGMKRHVQPNHQMTPDSIGILLAYFIRKFVPDRAFSMLDPAAGTGNLLTTILNQLPDAEIRATGIELDDLLVKLAYTGCNLQGHPVEFFNQDGLANLLVDPVDVVVCEPPVGYYTNDRQAEKFVLKAEEGHSFIHHLFIEQGCRYAKEGGYLFYVVPHHLFESKEAQKLNAFIKEHMHMQGFLHLPDSLFMNKSLAKSVLILQKKKEGIRPPKEIFLMKLPSLSNKRALAQIFAKFDQWMKENK